MKAGSVKISPEVKSLFAAIERKDLRRVRQLVERGLPVDSVNKDGWTPLLVATRDKRISIALFLIDHGANVNAKVPRGDRDNLRDASVLMVACEQGSIQLVDRLIAAKANVEATAFGCWTAIVHAATRGHLAIVRRCLEAGATVPENTWGWCLHRPAANGHADLLNALLDRIDAPPERLGRLLVTTAGCGHLECVKLLLQRGAPVSTVSHDHTALTAALFSGHWDIAKLLLFAGADENQQLEGRTADARSALAIAKASGRIEAMDLVQNAAALRAEAKVEVQRATTTPSAPDLKSATPAVARKAIRRAPPTRQEPPCEGGVGAFLDLMFSSQPEWSLYAVEVAFDTVVAAVREAAGLKKRWQNLPLVKPGKKFEVVQPLVTLVQLRGSAWTVVFKSLFDYQEPVEPEAQALSASLQTQVITFSGDDTANAMGYQLFAGGELVERADWEDGGEVHFHSERGRKLKQKTGDRGIAEAVFKELGILLPACYPRAQGDGFALAVIAPAPEEFAHVEMLGWP